MADNTEIDWTLAAIFGTIIGGSLLLAYMIGSKQSTQQTTSPEAVKQRKAMREEEITRLERQKLARDQFEEQQQRMERERVDRIERERLLEQDRLKRLDRESELEAKRLKKLQD